MTSDGGTANGGVNMTTVSFVVTVGGINQPPTLNPIANPSAILENTNTPQIIALSNITPGVGNPAGELVTVSASSSNPALIPNPAVTYTNFNNLGFPTRPARSRTFRYPTPAARRRSPSR